MKMEEHFRDTLRRAVANEPPVVDAWDRFERRARRGHTMRLGFSLAAGLAVIAAAVFVVPRLGSDPRGFVQPGGTQLPTFDPYAGWQPFVSGDGRFRLKYPSTWKISTYEGHWEFRPPDPGIEGLAKGYEGNFGIDIQVLDRDTFRTELPSGTRGIWPGGREFTRYEALREERALQVFYFIDWSASRCGIDGDCPQGDALVLQALIVGDKTLASFDEYLDAGELIVNSIERVD